MITNKPNVLDVISGRIELKKDGAEYKACCPFHNEKDASFSVVPDKDFYYCFGCGSTGDSIKFVMDYDGVDFKEACIRLGISLESHKQPESPHYSGVYVYEWMPQIPDAGVEFKAWNPKRDRYSTYTPAAVWPYINDDGQIIAVVLRINLKDGSKITPVIRWCRTKNGDEFCHYPMGDDRPLYGEPLNGKPVLLVEGEKTADAAAKLFPSYTVKTWAGGSKAWNKTDWQVLAGRDVVLWADCDDPGREVMSMIAGRLYPICNQVKMVLPTDKEKGWDLADALMDGWTTKDASNYARSIAKIYEPPAQTTQIIPERSPEYSMSLSMPLIDINSKGKPLSTIANLEEICRRLNYVVRYNVIKKEEEILIPEEGFSVDNQQNASIAMLISQCSKVGMPTGHVKDYLTVIADRNQFNPVKQWIESKPWDGQDRVSELIDTIQSPHNDIKNVFMRRWMISAVAAALSPDGISARGVLVLQGGQDVGKTYWFKRLVPKSLDVIGEGHTLNPADRDSVKQAVCNWLVELGELDATFKKSDIAALKSFLTKQHDTFRKAYAMKDSKYARRTVFFGTVNPRQYLHDETGNSRFWTIEITSINFNHQIDMQQAWAQVSHIWKSGEGYYMTKEESDMLRSHNVDYESEDPIKEAIHDRLNWEAMEIDWNWETSTEILRKIGIDRPSKSDVTRAGSFIRAINGGMSRKSKNSRLLYCPPVMESRNDGY